MTEFEQLFYQVRIILNKVNVEKTEKRKRGESFNIFDTLGLSTSEVRTHTAFLAELLNPDGSHGLGSFPLKTFVSIINNLRHIDFDSDNAAVRKELAIGPIDKYYDHGGQIDICIASGECAIIIENKINAGDQKKQLLRYFRYGQSYKDCVLLYLTLDRHAPSPDSFEDKNELLRLDEDFFCISYEEHITSLLNACIREAFDKPLIRETLIQYLNLITVLTYKVMDNHSKDELLKLMIEHSECVSEIISYKDDYLNKVVVDYLFPQLTALSDKHHLIMGETDVFLTKKIYVGIDLLCPSWNHFKIRIECESSNWKEVFIGVTWKDGNIHDNIHENFIPFSCMEGANRLWAGGWKYFSPRNLDYSAVPTILSGNKKVGFYAQLDEVISCIMEESKELAM